ncbi:MAG: chemotaxis response regulator protein-glutamate methylesterase, partial [Alphaproteobacteria bacterium HGW-Alphaproteobacteria-5]
MAAFAQHQVEQVAHLGVVLDDQNPRLRHVLGADSCVGLRQLRRDLRRFLGDVLTLDVEMPRMDGLTFLSKLMIASPMPVIMVSTLTVQGADVTLKALHLGAVDFMLKPAIDNEKEVQDFSRLIMEKVFMASQVKMSGR